MSNDREGIIKMVSAILHDKALYNLTNETTVTIIAGEIADGILAIKPSDKPEPEMWVNNAMNAGGHRTPHKKCDGCDTEPKCIPYVEADKPSVDLPEELDGGIVHGQSYCHVEMFNKINELCREVRLLKAEKAKEVV